MHSKVALKNIPWNSDFSLDFGYIELALNLGWVPWIYWKSVSHKEHPTPCLIKFNLCFLSKTSTFEFVCPVGCLKPSSLSEVALNVFVNFPSPWLVWAKERGSPGSMTPLTWISLFWTNRWVEWTRYTGQSSPCCVCGLYKGTGEENGDSLENCSRQ